MYLDISYGWQQRMDMQKSRKRRRRLALGLLALLTLIIVGGTLAVWGAL